MDASRRGYRNTIPKFPDNWEEMKYKERKAWKEVHIWDKNRAVKKRMNMEDTLTKQVQSIKRLKTRVWDDTSMMDWLRIATDKKIVGFTCLAVERINNLLDDMMRLKAVKVQRVVDGMRQELRDQFKAVREECIKEVKGVKEMRSDWSMTRQWVDSSKGFKRLDTYRYEKDGVVYRKIELLVNDSDFTKFRAILSMEGTTLRDWIRYRIRKYVTIKFKRLGELHELVDKDADKVVSDKEFEGGGDLYPQLKTKDQRQEEEIVPNSDISSKEDIKGDS